jgi:pimeloyl-ACP methyl ester carboxylesterase
MVDLSIHVEDVVAHIEMEDLQNVVLVGWSYGGMVSTGVLTRIPHRIKSMIYLDSFVPEETRKNRGLDWIASASVPMEVSSVTAVRGGHSRARSAPPPSLAPGFSRSPGTGVVLGEPGFDLGERGRRDRFGPRRGESLFPRESGYTKNSKAVTVVL